MTTSLVIVVPVNEVRCLVSCMPRLHIIDGLKCRTSILFVDDGSTDSTYESLLRLRRQDERINILRLSRNFGKESALTAGLANVVADAVLVMDADLQDPISLLPQMIEKLSEGFDVVVAKRSSRRADSILRRSASWIHYRLLRGSADIEIPADVGDFRLMSKRVVEAVNKMPETQRYMKGFSLGLDLVKRVSILIDQKESLAKLLGVCSVSFRML